MGIALAAGTYVTHATYAEVAMRGLTGGSVLELKLGSGSQAPLATSAAHPARIPMRAGVLGSLMAEAPGALQQLRQVLADAGKVLDDTNRAHVAAALAQIDAATGRLAAIEAHLPALLQGIQRSVDATHSLLASTDKLVHDAQVPVRNAAALEASIQALARSTRQLSERLDRQAVPDFDALSRSLLGTSRQLDELLRELKAKPQSLIFGPAQPPPGPGEPGFEPGVQAGPRP
jgi:phospholipid/cholesterol/gamma-HCH transport system substrate-binding protein